MARPNQARLDLDALRHNLGVARELAPGSQVMAVVNFPPRQIGPVMSEVLTLGAYDDAQQVVLLGLDHPVPNGSRMM